MRYQSKPETSKGIAIFTATFGCILLYFAGFVASGFGAFVLLLFGIALLVATLLAATASYSVTLDRDAGQIIKEFRTVMFARQSSHQTGAFQSVSIGAGGRGAFGENIVVYSAQLNGASTLRITPWTVDRSAAQEQARIISEYLNIPLNN